MSPRLGQEARSQGRGWVNSRDARRDVDGDVVEFGDLHPFRTPKRPETPFERISFLGVEGANRVGQDQRFHVDGNHGSTA